MEYSEFKDTFLRALRRSLEREGYDWQVLIQKMRRINENEVDAFSIIRKNQESHVEISRVFYLPDLYEVHQRDVGIEGILESVLDLATATFDKFGFGNGILSFQKYEKRIQAELIGRKRNEMLLEHIAYREFLDLAFIYRLKLCIRDGWTTSILITEEMLEAWSMTAEELHFVAMHNTSRCNFFATKNVGDLLELEPDEKDEASVYVMSNLKYEYGVVGIAFPEVMNNAARIIGGPFYILPSSIHEVLLVPLVPEREQLLKELIETSNREIVPPELQLSDSLYRYDMVTEKVELVR